MICMLEELEIWRLLAGLGIFLFGMHMLEESIEKLSGRAFKRLIRTYTQTRLRAILSGTVATAVLQSSSAVALMVLAFTGAGIISLSNAMGAIIGSNLGTTFKAWIVAGMGFRMNIEALALPLIALGGLGIIFFSKSQAWTSTAKLIAGLGFLFMGLDYMKSSVDGITTTMDVAAWAHWPAIFFLLLGLVLTAITQSSSASLVIVLSGLYSGIIDLAPACAFVIGANVGTTFTVWLGSLGGGAVKKQVALSHITFNWVTAVLMFLLLNVSLALLDRFFGIYSDPVLGLAVFHTFFNVCGIILFFPLLGYLGQFTRWVFPDQADIVSRYIHHTDPAVPEAAVAAIQHEGLHLAGMVMQYNNRTVGLRYSIDFNEHMKQTAGKQLTTDALYIRIKVLKGQIFDLSHRIQQHSVPKPDAARMNHYLMGIRLLLFSAKMMKDIKHDFDDFSQREEEIFDEIIMHFRLRQERINRMLRNYFEQPPDHRKVFDAANVFLESEEREFIRYYSDKALSMKIDPASFSTLMIVNKVYTSSQRNLINGIAEMEHAEPDWAMENDEELLPESMEPM